MGNFSLHNTIPEPDRSMDEVGFDNLPPHPKENFPKGTSTNTQFTLSDEVNDSSNTIKMPWPTPSGGNYGLRRY